MVLKRHDELKQRYFWGSGLCEHGYYVGTTGAVSEYLVRQYIEETEHWASVRDSPTGQVTCGTLAVSVRCRTATSHWQLVYVCNIIKVKQSVISKESII
jgi:hypothetical protein